ncbi:hypothetical protein [Porphyromonas loveana]
MEQKGMNKGLWRRFTQVLIATVIVSSAATFVGCVGAWLFDVPMIKGVVAALITPVLLFLTVTFVEYVLELGGK